jgi:hypothetical protein
MVKNDESSARELKELLVQLKAKVPTSAEMYAILGLDESRTFQTLRSEGMRKKYAFADCPWSDENPSSGYCYRLTGSVFVNLVDVEKKFTKEEMVIMKLKKTINERSYDHYFLVFYKGRKKEDAVLIDLTRDQIDKDDVHMTIHEYPYEEAVIADGRTMWNIRNGKEQTEFYVKFWKQYNQ